MIEFRGERECMTCRQWVALKCTTIPKKLYENKEAKTYASVLYNSQ